MLKVFVEKLDQRSTLMGDAALILEHKLRTCRIYGSHLLHTTTPVTMGERRIIRGTAS